MQLQCHWHRAGCSVLHLVTLRCERMLSHLFIVSVAAFVEGRRRRRRTFPLPVTFTAILQLPAKAGLNRDCARCACAGAISTAETAPMLYQ